MKKILILSLLASSLLVAKIAAAETPCLGGAFGGFAVKCHTEEGFKIGCMLTKEQIVLFRELVDANLQKKGYVSDVSKVGNSVTFSYNWNGSITEYYTYWNEATGAFEYLTTLN